ncbi:hypothetical protein WJX72_000831 [[Myrmecia] bisecta]|uniref:histone deacetylase n=1 Tax=[Myrmecia] bisecta TaxID=41462 RepID=A0AAW1QQ41_9CHLO
MSLKDHTVAYFYDEEMTNHNYGGGNPMRPHRVRLTNSLVQNYGLGSKMKVHRPNATRPEELTQFHADDYVDFLRNVTPDNQEEYLVQMRRFNLGPVGEADCPVFDDMYEYCRVYTGGSVNGAALMNAGEAEICLNWAGGMHHAKKAEASGFCYVNDIVLGILELLKAHERVLYVDIDIHHGDGVEEAFYLTDRVMTVSFHKYGDFFPGTGALGDVGFQKGRHYAVNVPLQEGMDDESYRFVFEPIMQKVMEMYQPGAVVVCGGADSLSGDRLGCFNLSLQGHSNCIEFLAKFGVPMMVLGGGGYTMRNVARCWCYETGRMLGIDLPDEIPESALQEFDYYMDTHKLRITVSNMKNANSRDKLEHIKTTVLQNLSQLPAVPSVPFQPRPPQHVKEERPEEEMEVRGGGQAYEDARVTKGADYASDDDIDGTCSLQNKHDFGEACQPPPEHVSAGPGVPPEAVGVKTGDTTPRPAPKPTPHEYDVQLENNTLAQAMAPGLKAEVARPAAPGVSPVPTMPKVEPKPDPDIKPQASTGPQVASAAGPAHDDPRQIPGLAPSGSPAPAASRPVEQQQHWMGAGGSRRSGSPTKSPHYPLPATAHVPPVPAYVLPDLTTVPVLPFNSGGAADVPPPPPQQPPPAHLLQQQQHAQHAQQPQQHPQHPLPPGL